MNIKHIRDEFPVKKHCLYFNFAADGPLPAASRAAIIDALEEKSNTGMIAVPKQVAVYEELRDQLAILFKSKRDHFAFIKNTSEGVLLALLAMDIKEDENYIVAADAFPTTIKMMESNCRGQKRTVKINGSTPLTGQLLEVMDKKTKAIVLDWVHYFTGKIIDIEAVTQLARERNIFTVIDGIQGAGALKLDLDTSGIDFFVAGGHKWLLSPQGSGFIYVSGHVWEKIKRKSFGWLGYNWRDFTDFNIEPELREGAAVMEYGTRSYMAALGLKESLCLINEIGIETIEHHNRGLRDFFIEKITEKGYETIYNEKSTSIIPFKSPSIDSVFLKKRLEENAVVVSLRNGYIRAAFHLVTDRQEVNRFINFL
jgi:selenocysteine lyase/cysteine desulfurase